MTFTLRCDGRAEFGFTPASRSRIAAPSPTEPSLFDMLEDETPDEEPAA
jgi:hypothetical protein